MAFEILEHLDKLKSDGGSNNPKGDHSFLCPACGSNNFKVNLTTGKWTAFGCDCGNSEAGKRKIRNALSPATKPETSTPTTKAIRPAASRSWSYFTAVTLDRDQPALTVHRTDDGNGKRKIWQESLVDGYGPRDLLEKVLPYGTPEARQALADGTPHIFWVEGEPCVDALRTLGLFAITSIGGAGKFNPDRDGPQATGIPADRLVVVPDQDKSGFKHAETIAASYPGCQWLLPFPGTPQWNGAMPAAGGLDIADWIELGATVQHILDGVGSKPQLHHSKQDPPISEWEQRILQAQTAGAGDPVAINDALMALLEERAAEVINSNRPIRTQKQAIKAVALSLGLKVNDNFVTELFDALDNNIASYEPDVQPGEVFTAQAQSWLLHQIFLVGLNLLVGMPGASKSRLLIGLIRAFLNDQHTFIGRTLQPGSSRQVMLIGTDQDRQQWGDLLAESALATEISRSDDEGGVSNIQYRLHPNITLLTSGGGFRMDADGLRRIREWNRSNPGGLLIIDSLSAVLPPGIKEADETAGRLMRQLDFARQGNACIITHHTTKNAAKEGELGVYSGSGSGSIDRAVSRFIGLGFETHLQHGKEKLHEDSPRRVLTSQKRGAPNQRLILENGQFNTWDYIGTAAEIRELQRENQEGPVEERLKGWKKEVWIATTDDWLSTDQIFARISPERAQKANAKQQVRESLRNLQDDHGIVEQHASDTFQGQALWRRKP